MGLRRRFLQMLAKGAPVEVDPEELVELVVVPLAQGPMLVTGLEREGIQAVGIESFDVITETRSRMRIMVRRSDISTAHQVLERIR